MSSTANQQRNVVVIVIVLVLLVIIGYFVSHHSVSNAPVSPLPTMATATTTPTASPTATSSATASPKVKAISTPTAPSASMLPGY